MLQLDGIDYEVKTPDENLDDVVSYVNDYCMANDIRNTAGEVIRIEPNEANPLYQMFRGFSYLTTAMQKLIYSAGCALSIPESSQRQLLNISDIAGIHRTQATRTIISGVIYANTEGPEAVPCTVTQEDTITITVAGTEITFYPAFDITVPIGESRGIVFIADQYGAFNISANTLTNFDDPIPGFRSLVTSASVPGHNIETISALRERLQRRTVDGTQIERAASAIQNLEGVSMCSIYFNYSPWEAASLPYGNTTISVAPRTALIMVQGWSVEENAIAKTFYRYMMCRTSGADVPTARPQTYITHAQQPLTVYIIPPSQQDAYIRIYIRNTLSFEQVDGIKDTICSLAGNITIGAAISSVDIINVVREVYTNLTVEGAEISLSGEEGTYSYKQLPASTSIFALSVENINVIEVQ